MQRKLSVCALKIANRNFVNGFTKESKEITASDIIRTHSRSFSPNLFRVSLADPINRMTARAFIAWMCFYLAIPQPARLGNASHIDSLGYEAERCLQPHLKDPVQALDVHGNHANSGCPSAASGRAKRHNYMKWGVYYLAKEAGLIVNEEPQTSNLLQKQFSPVECRSLFPKKSTKIINAEVKKLRKKFEEIEKKVAGTERAELRRSFKYTCKLFQKHYQSKGLRVDLQLIDPITDQER